MEAFNLICSEGIDSTENSLKIINPIGNLELPILPNNYSLFITFSVSEFDPTIKHKIHLKICNGENVVFNPEEGVDLIVPKENQDDEELIATLTASLNNFELNFPGKYIIEVWNEDKVLASSLFYVSTSSNN